ncbi:interleukin-17 receptor C isoform X2 [Triplophysa rosa]|uniref:interleukin-17 receptor C isoform X2 n=1 Tax=Triplophysa rosa TaxID=992332 RepID=UPI002545F71A|nr:interleukin-17 receptor C isoform X2 [Triplophysa rosa]
MERLFVSFLRGFLREQGTGFVERLKLKSSAVPSILDPIGMAQQSYEQCCCGAERCMPRLRLYTAQDVCVHVRLCVEPLLANKTLKIEFSNSETADSYTFLIWKQNHTVLWNSTNGEQFFQPHHTKIQIRDTTTDQTCWILRFVSCFLAQPGQKVSVSVYSKNEMLTSAEHITPDPVPKAEITVDNLAKHFTVRVKADNVLKIRLCYKHSYTECEQLTYFGLIDPQVNQTVNLSFPYLLPCLCVQLWYTGHDTKRNTQCPLKETLLPHGGDSLSSSSARVIGSVLYWKPVCLSDHSNLTVSLCWLLLEQGSHCVPDSNAALYGTNLKYNVSAVDKHPQMCVKFSLNVSHQVFCPFVSEDGSEWSVTAVPKSLHLQIHLTSNIAASFAAQLCAREGDKCVPQGNVLSCQVDGGHTEAELSVPFSFLSSGLCVQVWHLELQGRRIICPDYTHRRWGLIIGAALSLLAAVMVVVCITCCLVKRTISVWRCAERRPLLLVCSSDDTAHITAVCSLASGLQDELFMDVRLAQWSHCRSQPSLAQLGPQPWLYGQCQAMQKAGGAILIAWSLDAHHSYLRWRKSHSLLEKKWSSRFCNTGMYSDVEGGCEDKENMCYDEELIEKPRNSSLITAAVFNAALSCLWTGIHSDFHGEGFGLVCFQNLDTSNHIPKLLRCVQKYCLPRDLSTLIHDLGSSRNGIEKSKGNNRCWPRLLSKGLSFLVSRQLALRLAVKLPVLDRGSSKNPQVLAENKGQ